MNHDYAHCLDYDENCPVDCFRAELQKDLEEHPKALLGVPLCYTHFKGTKYCRLKEEKEDGQ